MLSNTDYSYLEHLQSAYTQFQRLEIAVEFIIAQEQSHQTQNNQFDFLPTNLIWRHIHRELQKIIQNLHTEIIGQGLVPQEPVLRSAIPFSVRCMGHAVHRDIRDLYIIKILHQVSSFYKDLFSNHF